MSPYISRRSVQIFKTIWARKAIKLRSLIFLRFVDCSLVLSSKAQVDADSTQVCKTRTCVRTCEGWPNGFASSLVSSRKPQNMINCTHIQLTCDQLNGEKLASTCVQIWARPKSTHAKRDLRVRLARALACYQDTNSDPNCFAARITNSFSCCRHDVLQRTTWGTGWQNFFLNEIRCQSWGYDVVLKFEKITTGKKVKSVKAHFII